MSDSWGGYLSGSAWLATYDVKPDPRPSWDQYGLDIARVVATRADCTRRRIGAVIIDVHHTIIATGYNGAPAGQPGCLTAGACPRGKHYRQYAPGLIGGTCICGNSWPCMDAVAADSSYDTGPGSRIAVHAEANALLRAGTASRGATLYVTNKPCDGCARLIAGAGIARTVYPDAATA